MIKLKSLICEMDENEVDKYIDILKNDSQISRIPIYRGTRSLTQPFQKMDIIGDRRPKDTTYFSDSFFEIYRKKYFPDKPSRRESIFCSNDFNFAIGYGNVYEIFPSKSCEIHTLKENVDSINFTSNTYINRIWYSITGDDFASRIEKDTQLFKFLEAMLVVPAEIDKRIKYIDSIVDFYFDAVWDEVKNSTQGLSYEMREAYNECNRYFESIISYDMNSLDRKKEIYITGNYYYAIEEKLVGRYQNKFNELYAESSE